MQGYFQQKWINIPFLLQIQAAKPLVDTSARAAYSHLYLKLGKLKVFVGCFT